MNNLIQKKKKFQTGTKLKQSAYPLVHCSSTVFLLTLQSYHTNIQRSNMLFLLFETAYIINYKILASMHHLSHTKKVEWYTCQLLSSKHKTSQGLFEHDHSSFINLSSLPRYAYCLHFRCIKSKFISIEKKEGLTREHSYSTTQITDKYEEKYILKFMLP